PSIDDALHRRETIDAAQHGLLSVSGIARVFYHRAGETGSPTVRLLIEHTSDLPRRGVCLGEAGDDSLSAGPMMPRSPNPVANRAPRPLHLAVLAAGLLTFVLPAPVPAQ